MLTVLILVAIIVPLQAAVKNLEQSVYYDFQEYRDRCTAIAVGKSSSF